MPDPTLKFRSFLDRVKDEDAVRIISAARYESASALASAKRTRSKAPDRSRAYRGYDRLLGGFLFFMQHGVKPDGLSQDEFLMLRPVVESLVKRGQLKPEALSQFG